jgi:hypothetical protein
MQQKKPEKNQQNENLAQKKTLPTNRLAST